ncbi:MAG TPA: hypothetical protein ENL10_05335 [Candidatus Cloacimonetes bacterium]|nr:hypothetical protein [Candidatus Cloacimonadota bacterium]
MSHFGSKKTIITGIGAEEGERLKNRLLCMPDLLRNFTWQEIDGVRRTVKIVFTSAALDADEGKTIVFTRDFIYEAADPFDLDKIQDTLVVS